MIILFSCWPCFAFGQVATGFESSLGAEWIQFPLNCWEISPDQALSGQNSLHHSFDNSISGTDKISLNTGIFDLKENVSWEFLLRYGYSPSSSNKWKIFLATDKSATDPVGQESINGYLLGVNVKGNDDTLCLYAIKNGEITEICKSSLNYEKDIGSEPFHCLVKRNSSKLWEVYAAKDSAKLNNAGNGYEPDIELPSLMHFKIEYSYTAAKDRLLWFDDLNIQAAFLIDAIPPELISYDVPDRNTLKIKFSEEVDGRYIKNDQFTVRPGSIHPDTIILNGSEIVCSFSEEFAQSSGYQMIVNAIKDKEGNLSDEIIIDFIYYKVGKNDLVITEIMADPYPVVYLDESEYIEIYNRSKFPIDLDSFKLQIGRKEYILPDYLINPDEYVVVTDHPDQEYSSLAVFSGTSVITNDGQQVLIKDKTFEIISAAEFKYDWYGDDFKSGGGWSLERIDAENLCGGRENWRASEDPKGGTPGKKNSVQAVNPDITIPLIERLEFIDENRIRLVFSENLDPQTIPAPVFFKLSPSSIRADSVIFSEYFCSFIEIVFDQSFQAGATYEISIPEVIADCSGNLAETSAGKYFGLPSTIELTDIIISEVMYNGIPGCPEYIELYNQSEHLLDLSDLRVIINKKEETGSEVIPISTPVLFPPFTYHVLCREKSSLLSCYQVPEPDCIIECIDLPVLPDDGACIRLDNRSLGLVDFFCYAPEDQFPMLSDCHGVSLERMRLDRKTGDQSSWHSASSVSGFGTPGYQNSQSLSGIEGRKTIEITPEIFSPDNDGKDDMLEVHYIVDKEGFVGTIVVFDPSGRIVCFLGKNEILGTSGMFLWDGRDNKGNVCKTGLYLIYAELWNLKGEKEKFKKAVVLVRN